ncbi:hypothetical protein CNR22_11330 [Sphingobacteriaceae bacterium]|nr:hypothetical protein CNR22_11330 [Sphingobacteriaceae bacterium]
MQNTLLYQRFIRSKNLNRFICLLALALIFQSGLIKAQAPGDTIFVKGFKYGSTTRDTMIQFPSSSLTFEKIIMKYNMRCKNNLVSTQAAPNQGCGEWDYSCNTYIVDSSRIENELNIAPKYVISNFSGNTFNYTSLPVYDYWNFTQTQVVLGNVISETSHTLSAGTTAVPNFLKASERSGHSQLLYTAAELTSAGFTAGNIDAFLLNVANAGGPVHFLKVGIQNTSQTVLTASAVTLTGFTNVYNANYTFTAGANRVQFHSPFVWNGTSNILIDYSFTNTNGATSPVFNGSAAAGIMSLYANNNYALDLSASGHVNINTVALAAISNELSISLWAYGTASLMPTTTSILYATDANANHRQLNIHLPWDNNDVYFDCGYVGTDFDRIQKTSVAAEQGGQWNHWTFTKNASTGLMAIYLNGALWTSGTGKTRAISILNMVLGKTVDLTNNYKGKVNELVIWSKELSLANVQAWMKKPIDASHPNYANLVGYYKMNEGSGLILNDSKNNATSLASNVQWTYERGDKLNRMFYETNLRPELTFLRGTYAMTTTTVTVKDSVARNPNIVLQYSITSNASASPAINDVVQLVSTTGLYQALASNVYNGDTGVLTGTIAVATQSSLTMAGMNYYKRYPYYNEIMSFVTPYGKGLTMTAKGKSWYFDVSDFAPILKGKKRLMMALGGENQEQMDIDFWFIVGTPPRNVVEFNQLWQGAARAGQANIGSIVNDTRYTTQTVSINSAAQTFKVRSTITGHGQEGEFSQSGGVINHYFNVNGGANEFSWPITLKCSANPVYPQGGTWIYMRQGWCPGMASRLTENYITPFVTPGSTVTLDYNCSTPANINGDYRYIAAHQLVSYGGANHTLDAAITDVLSPSTKVLYSRQNPMCSDPLILITNTGSGPVTSMDIDYWLNDADEKQNFQWTGNLAFMDTITIKLPVGSLWSKGLVPANNIFHAEIKTVNGVVDQYAYNNKYNSAVAIPDVLPEDITVEFKTNVNYFENSYQLFDSEGTDVSLQTPLTSANTLYTDVYSLSGCYTLKVQDSGEDGLSFWANTAQGSGLVRIKNSAGTVIKSFNMDFGSGFEYSFSTVPSDFVGLKEQNFASGIKMYPNPTHDKFFVNGKNLEGSTIKLIDLLGREISVPVSNDKSGLVFDVSCLKAGVYLVSITSGKQSAIKKIVVN